MAQQFLSDFSAPSINANVARRVLANEVLYMIAQGVIETDKQGITSRFSNDTAGAEIRIVIPQALNIGTRELGASLNGDNFANSVKQPKTTSVGLAVLQVIDTPIDIPQVTQDMIPIDLLETQMRVLGMEINTQINGMTIASKLANTLPAISRGEVNLWTIDPETDTGAQIRYTLTQANSALDDGDAMHNLAYFPNDDRIMVIRPSMRPLLLKEGVIIAGGSNYAQDIIKSGAVSTDASRDYSRSAIIGEFDGLPVASASPIIWKTACEFLGLPVYALDEVLGYISSGYANVRAIAQQEQMKIIDSPDGVGVRLQPLVRMGARSFYPAGNQIIATSKFDVEVTINLAGGVIPDSDPNYAGNLLVRGSASRTALKTATDVESISIGGVSAQTAGTNEYNAENVSVENEKLTIEIDAPDTKVELVNYKAFGALNPIAEIDGIFATVNIGTKRPGEMVLRVIAPAGNTRIVKVAISYAN